MALIDDPHHGGDAYRYVDAEQLKQAAPHLLQACLQGYLTLISPCESKDIPKIISYLQEAMKVAGHPAGDHARLPDPLPDVGGPEDLIRKYKPFGCRIVQTGEEYQVIFPFSKVKYRYTYNHQNLKQKSFIFVARAFHDDPSREPADKQIADRYREVAREKYSEEGVLEIDENAEVSMYDKGMGAYVQAWKWLSHDELSPPQD